MELSKRVGITNVTISRYLNGQRKPQIDIIAKIAEILGTSIDYLLGFSNSKNFTPSKFRNLGRIQNKLETLGLLDANKELSNSQVLLIEKLLDANREFIEKLKDPPSKGA